MADDQQPPAQRYWFPYWTAPAPRPVARPQLSRRETRPAPSPPATASPSRRPSHPQQAATPASRGAGGGVPDPPAQPQPTRLSSRPSPSPSRAQPLSPIREPNASPAPVAKEHKQPSPLHHTEHGVPKQKDITVPQEKTIHEPLVASKTQTKTPEKEKDKEKGKEKEKEGSQLHKEKDKEKKDKERRKRKKIKRRRIIKIRKTRITKRRKKRIKRRKAASYTRSSRRVSPTWCTRSALRHRHPGAATSVLALRRREQQSSRWPARTRARP